MSSPLILFPGMSLSLGIIGYAAVAMILFLAVFFAANESRTRVMTSRRQHLTP
jgi:hypothetical protein